MRDLCQAAHTPIQVVGRRRSGQHAWPLEALGLHVDASGSGLYPALVSFYNGPVRVVRDDGAVEEFWDELVEYDSERGLWKRCTHEVACRDDGELWISYATQYLSARTEDPSDEEWQGSGSGTARVYYPGQWSEWSQDGERAGEPRPTGVLSPPEAIRARKVMLRDRWLAENTGSQDAPVPELDVGGLTMRRHRATPSTNVPERLLVKSGTQTVARVIYPHGVLTFDDPAYEPHRLALVDAVEGAGHDVVRPLDVDRPDLLAVMKWVGAWGCFAVEIWDWESDLGGGMDAFVLALYFPEHSAILCNASDVVARCTAVVRRHGMHVQAAVDEPPPGYRPELVDRARADLGQLLLTREISAAMATRRA